MTTYILLATLVSALCWADQHGADELYRRFNTLGTEQLMDMGTNYYSQHQGEEALACFSVVIARYRDNAPAHDKNRVASALNNRGCIYKFLYYDYTRAYEDLSRSLLMCEETHNTSLQAKVFANMGSLLNDYSRQYGSDVVGQQAQQFFERSFMSARAGGEWELLATSFANLAEFNHDIDLSKFKALLDPNIPDTVPNMRYARLLYHAIEHLQRNDYPGARTCFEQQKQVIDWHDTPERPQIIATMNVAATYMAQNNHLAAIDLLLQAEKVALAHDVKDLEFQICRQLSECYRQTHQSEQARIYHIAYLEKKDSLMRANQLVSVGEQSFITELRQVEDRVKSLTARHRIQSVVLVLSALILLIVAAFALVVRKKNKQLTERNKTLYERMQTIIAAQEQQLSLLKAQHLPPGQDVATSVHQPPREKYSGSRLGDDEKERILLSIQEAMNTPELICTQGFTITQLAAHLGSNSTYVSQVINEKYGYSFNVLLGNSRIMEACRRMRDKEYGQLTIEAISQSVGFKSRVTFITAFKRVVGMTPSEYLKAASTSSV